MRARFVMSAPPRQEADLSWLDQLERTNGPASPVLYEAPLVDRSAMDAPGRRRHTGKRPHDSGDDDGIKQQQRHLRRDDVARDALRPSRDIKDGDDDDDGHGGERRHKRRKVDVPDHVGAAAKAHDDAMKKQLDAMSALVGGGVGGGVDPAAPVDPMVADLALTQKNPCPLPDQAGPWFNVKEVEERDACVMCEWVQDVGEELDNGHWQEMTQLFVKSYGEVSTRHACTSVSQYYAKNVAKYVDDDEFRTWSPESVYMHYLHHNPPASVAARQRSRIVQSMLNVLVTSEVCQSDSQTRALSLNVQKAKLALDLIRLGTALEKA